MSDQRDLLRGRHPSVRPPSRGAVAILVVAALGATVFMMIAEDVLDGGGLISRDDAVLAWFVRGRTEWSVTLARWVSTLGSFVVLLAVAAAFALWSWGRRHLSPWLALAPLASLSIGGLLSTVSKAAFGRDRPPVVLHRTTVALDAFPSGHATNAAAFFVAASLVVAVGVVATRWARGVVVMLGLAAAGLVGISRLLLAVHWLSDVVAAWALGTSVALCVVLGSWKLAARVPETLGDSGESA